MSQCANKMKQNFEQMAVKLIHKESLLQIINNGNKVISENAHGSILSILENV